jgi:hypothetical protein
MWALHQLRTAAEQFNQDSSMSSVTARTAVACMLSSAADTFAVDCVDEAAAALLAALPQLLLPPQLAAQVLVQTYDLVPAAVWSEALHATSAAAAAGTASGNSSAVVQLLLVLVQEVQLQLRVNVKGPEVYAEVLLAAADGIRPDSEGEEAVVQLLQVMLTGEQAPAAAAAAASGRTAATPAFRGVPLAASAAAQLVIELSRRRTATSSSSNSGATYNAEGEQDAAARQLLVVGAVAPAILQHFSSSSSTSVLVNCLAGQLYQTALLPHLYLTLLLQPRVSSGQWITLVRQLGLTSGNTPQVAVASARLCNTLQPGIALPVAAYAAVLATALDIVCTDSINAAYPEARVGLELEKQQRQQQLLAAVVAVLGTFRGMRAMHASPLGAQLLLPMFDLAAVLCYCQELLPAGTAAALAAAVARALGQLDGRSSGSNSQQLVQLLAQLPNAAAAGFGKGAELWMPLLQQMAVAGGMSDAEEAELIAKLTAVAAAQGLAMPVRIASSDGPPDGEVRFADPAAAAAARGAAGSVKTAAAAAAAGVTSHPVPVTAADVDDNDGVTDSSSAFDVTENALEVIAAVSLSVASTAATAALAAGYGAAGALVGLVWGAAAMTAGALAVSGNDASSTKEESATATAAAGKNAAVAAVSPPDSPRTPLIQDVTPAAAAAAGGSNSGAHRATMGGRTKADQEAPLKPAVNTSPAAAAAFGYGGSAMATGASAAAAAGQGSGLGFGAGFGVLGSLAVDPDEVVKKIRSQSAHMTLDEAVMQVRCFVMRSSLSVIVSAVTGEARAF